MNTSTCHSRCIKILLILACIMTLTGGPSLAADKTPAGKLFITSDKLVAEQGNAMAEFIGNVKATRGDSVLLADRVKVYFSSPDKKPSDKKEKTNDQGNVDKIVASGNVEYTAGNRKAFADEAVYTTVDEKLVLTGKEPKLLTGNSWVAGRKITLFRLEERVIVESGGTKRVQAFFDSQDQAAMKAKGDGTE